MLMRSAVCLALLLAVEAHGHGHGHGGGKGRRLGENGHGLAPQYQKSMMTTMMSDDVARPGPHPPGPPPKPENPCKMDFWRFCAFRVEDMHNMEEIVACMKSHDAELQPQCKTIIDDASATIEGFHTACDPSLKSFGCDVTKPEATRMCLVEHLDGMDKLCLKEVSTIMLKHAPKGPEMTPEWAIIDPAAMGMGPEGPGMDMMGLHHVIVKSILCAVFIATLAGLSFVLMVKCCARCVFGRKMCRRNCCNEPPQMQMGVPVEGQVVHPRQADPTAYASMA